MSFALFLAHSIMVSAGQTNQNKSLALLRIRGKVGFPVQTPKWKSDWVGFLV